MMQQQKPNAGIIDNIKSGLGDVGETITSTVNDIGVASENAKNTFSSTLDSAKSFLPPAPIPTNGSSFSLSDYTVMSSEFLESNSLIARAAFVLLVVFTFFVLLRLLTGLIKYFVNRSADPIKLIDGMVQDATVSQGPFIQGSVGKTIFRSNDEETGIEFTWAVSLYVKDFPIPTTTTPTKKYLHVFSKGSVPTFTDAADTIATINQAPGLYINTINNSLVINMDTFNNTTTTELEIPQLPHNKWINVIIRCKNTTIDVYINGQLAKSTILPNVPKQNYGSVYACFNTGFAGSISNLWYYKHALSINEIQNSMTSSVNTTLTSESTVLSSINQTATDYLSFKWYGA